MSLKPLAIIKIQIYKCNNFFNVQNSTKCFSFQLQLGCLVSHFEFSHTHKTTLNFSFFCFVISLFLLFRRLEVRKLLKSSNFVFFCILSTTIRQCSVSSSCDIDSALSVSVSCNTSFAILTLMEAVLQHFCSSTLCLPQGRGSTLDSLFLQKLLWRHNVTLLSKSSFNISSFSFPLRSLVLEILFTAVVTAFR